MKNQHCASNPAAECRASMAMAALTRIPPGHVRTWFCPDVIDALASLEAALAREPGIPLLALAWSPGADLPHALDHIVHALAGIAWVRWPDWYGDYAPFLNPDVGAEAAADFDSATIDRLGATRPSLNRAWVLQAVRHCRQGRRPAVNAFPPAVQVRQLMLALAQPDLILLLALENEATLLADLQTFARTAAWTASETGARVAAFIPAAHRDAAELDTISYSAIGLADAPPRRVALTQGQSAVPKVPATSAAPAIPAIPAIPAVPEVPEVPEVPAPPATATPTSHPTPPRRHNDEPLRLVSPPILGHPHPASPGEQLLAQWLARDTELAPLFAFNQRVETSSGESFVVDLLWCGGKLTVEVDGYGWHSSPHAFAADRHRDYRLLCDGYRTLRLPHDEVLDDPALQREKIRDIVRAIQKERPR